MKKNNQNLPVREAAQRIARQGRTRVEIELNELAQKCVKGNTREVAHDKKSVSLIFSAAISDDAEEEKAASVVLRLLLEAGEANTLRKRCDYILIADKLAESKNLSVAAVGERMRDAPAPQNGKNNKAGPSP